MVEVPVEPIVVAQPLAPDQRAAMLARHSRGAEQREHLLARLHGVPVVQVLGESYALTPSMRALLLGSRRWARRTRVATGHLRLV